MDPGYLAVLAVKLAILTFYLGVLIYALPLPFPFIKRWGPQLLWDSMLSLLLATLYAALYVLSSRIAVILGGSWTLYGIWYKTSLSIVLSLKMLLAALTALPEISRLTGVIYSIAAPLDRAATLALLFLTTLAGIAELVYNYGLILIAVGVVLYAIPLRLARSAGAWLIAFVIVFNIGLQALPIFITSFANAPQIPETTIDYRLLTVKVTGDREHPVARGFLVLKDNRGDIIAYHELDVDGYAKSKLLEDKKVVLPATRLYPYVEHNGLILPLEPWPLRVQDYSNGETLTLRAPHLIVVKQPFIIAIAHTPTPPQVVEGDNWFEIKAAMSSGDYLEVRYPNYCNISIASSKSASSGVWEWRGLRGFYYKVEADAPGDYIVSAQIIECDPPILPSNEGVQDYLDKLVEELRFIDINLLKAFILYYLTVPTIYVFILFLATGALARVLGGKDRIPVRVA